MSEELPLDPCSNRDFIECHVAVVLWKVFSPLFMIIGISGNILAMAVLSRRRMRSTTTSVYLRLLAIVDTMVLLMAVLRNIIHYYTGINIRELSMYGCKFHTWISTSVTAISFWLLPVIAIDRLILVKYPIWAKKHCSRRSSVYTVLVMTVIIFLINIHIVAFHSRIEVFAYPNKTQAPILIDVKCNPGSEQYKKFYNKIWPVIMFALFTVFPMVVLITSNIVLVRELTKRNVQNLARRSIGAINEREQRDLRSVTKMLISICVFFVIISVPTSIHLTVGPYIFDRTSPQDIAKQLLSWSVVTLLLYSNNTVNFILYCFSGRVFRKELFTMLRHAKLSAQQLINRRVYPGESTDDQPQPDNKEIVKNDGARSSSLNTKSTQTNTNRTEGV